MSRSCQSATSSIAGTTAIRTSRARPVRFSVRTGLRLCGIADEPFWPGAKYSSASSTSVRCRWRISTASRSIELAITPERREEHRVPVARDHLGRDRLRRQPHRLRHVLLDRAGRCWRRCRPRRRSRRSRSRRGPRPGGAPAAVELGVGLRELQPEGRRLGVDAVAAADRHRVLVLEGARASAPRAARRGRRAGCRRRGSAARARQVSSTSERGHALVHEARLVADDARRDASGRRSRRAWSPPRSRRSRATSNSTSRAFQIASAADFGITPSSAWASAACASISNQMRKRVSGDQIATISGRE